VSLELQATAQQISIETEQTDETLCHTRTPTSIKLVRTKLAISTGASSDAAPNDADASDANADVDTLAGNALAAANGVGGVGDRVGGKSAC
jgi:hypothetical protein